MTQRIKFPLGVSEELNWYVYRLIDPRNGETFYVGKGKGDRIFQHAIGALKTSYDADNVDLKASRIKSIMSAGLEVGHVVHRHKIESEEIALQIEAALIDAYPGLTNIVGGHESGDYGCRHVEQVITEYETEPFIAREPLILISISKSFNEEGKNVYEAVRSVWKISENTVKDYKLVLAHIRGIVVGAFRPTKWLRATKVNFPLLEEDIIGRIGFEGIPAEDDVLKLYMKKRVPDKYRRKGAANPIRLVSVDDCP